MASSLPETMQRGAAARYGDLPDLPRIAGLLFAGEENALAVKGDGGIGGGSEAGRQHSFAAGCNQLKSGAGGKALAALQARRRQS